MDGHAVFGITSYNRRSRSKRRSSHTSTTMQKATNNPLVLVVCCTVWFAFSGMCRDAHIQRSYLLKKCTHCWIFHCIAGKDRSKPFNWVLPEMTISGTIACVRSHQHANVCMCMRLRVCVCARVYVCMCECVCVCVCVRFHVCVCMCVCTFAVLSTSQCLSKRSRPSASPVLSTYVIFKLMYACASLADG